MQSIQHHRPESLVTIARRYPAGGGKSVTIELPHTINANTLLSPGALAPISIGAARLAVETTRRIAPWCDVILTPRLLYKQEDDDEAVIEIHDGERWKQLAGMHSGKANAIYIGMRNPQTMLNTACHESWHALEKRIGKAALAMVDDELSPLSYGHGDKYWSNPEERRARAFESWCARLIDGVPCSLQDTAIDMLFAMAWTGELGEKLHQERKEFA